LKVANLNFNQVDNKVSGHEQIIMTLLQRVENLEQERQRTNILEQTVGMLLQRVDTLEHECQQLRAIAMPQQSNSSSNNQLAQTLRRDIGNREMVLMKIEDNEQPW
jgi:cob(I)alamin adenosyltransferase